MKLAAAQRMNTDSRRAAFCVLMASDDYVRTGPLFIFALIFVLFGSMYAKLRSGLTVLCREPKGLPMDDSR